MTPTPRKTRLPAVALAAIMALGVLASPSRSFARDRHTTRAACPSALTPGSTAAAGVVAAVQRDMASLYNKVPGHTKYRIVAMAALTSGPQSVGIESVVAPYRGIASHHCGSTVANRSWVVFLYFPYFKSSASMSEGVVFAARTAGGWHVWYVYH